MKNSTANISRNDDNRVQIRSTRRKLSVALVAGSLLSAQLVSIPNVRADSKEGWGGFVGAVIGYGIGRQVGDRTRNGKGAEIAAGFVGAIVGAYVGGQIGKELDDRDRRKAAAAEIESFGYAAGAPVRWDGRDYRSPHVIGSESYWLRQGSHSRYADCRESYSVIRTHSGDETYRSVWCERDGKWNRIGDSSTIQTIRWCDASGCGTEVVRMNERTRRGGGGFGHADRRDGQDGAVVPDWIAGEDVMYNIMIDLNRRATDGDRDAALVQVYNSLARSQIFLSLDQLARILLPYSTDGARAVALNELIQVTDRRYGRPENVLVTFRTDSGKERAQRILR